MQHTPFKPFAENMERQIHLMSKGELYRAAISGDEVWDAYMAAFPEGHNDIYRTRRYYEGSYDKNFVRKMGNVVRISDTGQVSCIWDATNLQYPFNMVAQQLGDLVKSRAIDSIFRIKESSVGYVQTHEQTPDGVHTWNHFYCKVDPRHCTKMVDEKIGDAKTTVQVLKRGLEEIHPDAIQTVIDLTEQGNLYRGSEFLPALKAFQVVQRAYVNALFPIARSVVLWHNHNLPVARLWNTAIGALLQDLSDGTDLEVAVSKYERMMAPTNYRRPTALITKGMIEKADKVVEELGLESALQRRFATLKDLSINNVLWVDGRVQSKMKGGGLMGLLADHIHEMPKKMPEPSQISIGDFMEKVLPAAIGLELFFSNTYQNNLVSLTAPAAEEVAPLFKWDNNFAWSYCGDITDSIKEKVKAAGGNVEAKLRVSLAWYNFDDLDIHCHGPEGHIYFGAPGGGGTSRFAIGSQSHHRILDVDMNAGGGTTRTPVENLAWKDPKDGHYVVFVNQYCRRETDNVGFALQLEFNNRITQFSYQKATGDNQNVSCFEFWMKNGEMVDFKMNNKDLTGEGISQGKWGLDTERFQRVDTVLLSPNYWDGQEKGNKHWIFVLDKCHNPESTRGIYNEFLRPELEQHRKVFEVLGNKTKCPATDEPQLSGLGFSSTQRNSVIAQVHSPSSVKVYQINF